MKIKEGKIVDERYVFSDVGICSTITFI